jgi:hypothetical protein
LVDHVGFVLLVSQVDIQRLSIQARDLAPEPLQKPHYFS